MLNWNQQRKFRIPGRIIFRVFILFVILTAESLPQVKTNMELFYALIDTSAGKALSELPGNTKEIYLTTTLGESYSVFNNRIIAAFNKKSIKTDGSSPRLNFVIDDANVKYSEMFRNGLFGEYLVSREVLLKGNYLIDGSRVKEFVYSSRDTVSVDDLSSYENYSYPFTHSEIPAEPFFSGLFEPVLAISAAAAAVVLFFTLRSH